ncbi:unnamed protein product [Boreogadus saida]
MASTEPSPRDQLGCTLRASSCYPESQFPALRFSPPLSMPVTLTKGHFLPLSGPQSRSPASAKKTQDSLVKSSPGPLL